MTTPVEAEATVAELTAKRDALVAHIHELEQKRQDIAFKAHTGNKAERTKLDHINKKALTQSYELTSLDAAIAEATTRLADARREEVRAADHAQAQQLRAVVERFVQHGHALDKALQELARQGQALRECLNEIHTLGSPFPGQTPKKIWKIFAFSRLTVPGKRGAYHYGSNDAKSNGTEQPPYCRAPLIRTAVNFMNGLAG